MDRQRDLAGIPPAARVELRDYLRTSGSTLSMSEALRLAIKHWIAAQRAAAEPPSRRAAINGSCCSCPQGA